MNTIVLALHMIVTHLITAVTHVVYDDTDGDVNDESAGGLIITMDKTQHVDDVLFYLCRHMLLWKVEQRRTASLRLPSV